MKPNYFFYFVVLGFFALILGTLICGCAPHPTGVRSTRSSTQVPAAIGQFEDMTEASGIQFRHTNGDSGQLLYPETFGGGCAFLDYDNDGKLDVLLLSPGSLDASKPLQSPHLTLYHNDANGRFTDATAPAGLAVNVGYGQAVAIGDYDNDGFPDVFVVGYGECHLFHNAGGPAGRHFEDVTESAGLTDKEADPRWASAAAWGDYNNDGKLDLVLVHYAVWSKETNKQCPRKDGTLSYCPPLVYDGDGIRLFRNEGEGRFHDVTVEARLDKVRGRGLAVAWFDPDDDGRQDIYIANDLDPNYLLHNRGDGTFVEQAVQLGAAFGNQGRAASGMGLAFGDYDHSGRQSLFVTNISGEQYSLFHAEPGGTFTYATDQARLGTATLYHTGWGTSFIDLDRDGWVDLITANGNVHPFVAADFPGMTYKEPKGVYRNNGDGTFEDISQRSGAMTTERASRGMAVGDYDGDGKLDVLCINRNDRAELFHNVSKDTNHWISLSLVGTKSNRDGAGAKVAVYAGGVRQTAEVRLSDSYASSSDKKLFFGLKQATSIDKINIRWPSGVRQTIRNPRIDSVVNITEAPDAK